MDNKLQTMKVDFSRALLKYANPQKDKEMMVKYREALKIFAKHHLPSLMATQEEWNKLFDKF